MKLPINLVFVKEVISSVARSTFPVDQVEKVANLIINVEGIINPIIVRRTGLESYDVVDGHFEYYAAVRARELSPLKGELIQAIILEPDTEETLLEQVNVLRRNSALLLPSTTKDITHAEEAINPEQVVNIESQFVNLERIFKAQFDELQKSNRHLESRLSEIVNQNSRLAVNEELINQIAQKVSDILTPIISSLLASQKSSPKSQSSSKALLDAPLNLNLATEEELSRLPGISKQILALIIEKRKIKETFSSIEQLIEIKGIGTATINKWRNYLVV